MAPSFEGWTPERRRGGATSLAEDILNHLRGDKNEIFKI